MNLETALKVRDRLTQAGFQVQMTRDSDTGALNPPRDIPTWSCDSGGSCSLAADGSFNSRDDLQARVNLANGVGEDGKTQVAPVSRAFISLHANSFTDSAVTGTETYAFSTTTAGYTLASYVQQEVAALGATQDRGVKTNTYYVLRWTTMAAALLETGFLSNDAEARLLDDPAFQDRLAQAVTRAMLRFANLTQKKVERISGPERYATAVAVSAHGWPHGSHDVIVATGEAFPDALAGAALAGKLKAPVLLTKPTLLPEAVSQEITRLGAQVAWVLGGDAAVGPEVRKALTDKGLQVSVLSGADRYETAAAVARTVGTPSNGTAVVATGEAFPDALAFGPIAGAGGMPILLTRKDELPASTQQALTDLAISKTLVAGGSAAVTDSVVAKLPSPTRVAGADRYATAAAAASLGLSSFGLSAESFGLATGEAFPDALGLGALGALAHNPLVLTTTSNLPAATESLLSSNRSRVLGGVAAGGTAAISDGVISRVETVINAP